MILVFDVDRSLASIGGPQAAEKIFGCPPVPISGGLAEIKDVLRRLFRKQQVRHKHPLLGTEHIEERLELRDEAKKLGLHTIVIDTLSIAAEQERVRIMQERKLRTMDLQAWGQLTDTVMRFVQLLALLPITVICNVHVDRSKDELGALLDVPAIKGSSKYDMGRCFDLILYTVVERTREGRQWSWQTQPDPRRLLAKDRLGVLDERIPQDFSLALKPYRERGIHPKVLVVGDSGHGKTYALKTLKDL